MYPNLYYAFRDLFGIKLTGLRFVNSFGFFVALAFLAAAWVLTVELKRKERAGLLPHKEVKITVGYPATIGDLFLNFILGFILGYKIIGLFLSNDPASEDPQAFIFSSKGNWPIGIALGVLFAGLKWWEKNKQKMAKPEERMVRIWPHDRVGDIVIYAAVFGFAGAKVFHNLENWNEFAADPIGALLSFSGLTFYGGLICAAIAIRVYAKRQNIGFKYLCDAAAPALMIAYAIGRIGCQVSGDGDWGILNSAYYSTGDAKVALADSKAYDETLKLNSHFYLRNLHVDSLSDVPHKHVKAPSWLPDWMVAYNYPHNVVNEGAKIDGCTDNNYCNQLPIPVFPTPFYEAVASFFLFLLLWSLRTKLKIPGTLFAIYLIVNGIERFFVEKIRVNTKYDILFHPTQAELISTGLVISGVLLYFFLTRNKKATTPAA